MYLAKSSGPLTEMMRRFQDVANWETKYVFPVPGGPYKSTPAWLRRGEALKMLGYCKGNTHFLTTTFS